MFIINSGFSLRWSFINNKLVFSTKPKKPTFEYKFRSSACSISCDGALGKYQDGPYRLVFILTETVLRK